MNQPSKTQLNSMLKLMKKHRRADGMPTKTLEELIEMHEKRFQINKYPRPTWAKTLKNHLKEKAMRLSTKKTATFQEWFTTLQQVAMHDYSMPITDQEQGEWGQFYRDGLNQTEALGA